MCQEKDLPLHIIDLVPMRLGNLNVSARTEKGIITLNQKMANDQDLEDQAHYIIHELQHFFDQCFGDQPTPGFTDDSYLDNPEEIKGFQAQTQYLSEEESPQAAQKYINKVLDHHQVYGPKREEKEKQLLKIEKYKGWIKSAANILSPQDLLTQISSLSALTPEKIEDAAFEIANSWIDTTRYLHKVREEFNKLTINAQLIRHHKNRINEIFSIIQSYADIYPQLKDLVMQLKGIRTDGIRELFSIINSVKELEQVISGFKSKIQGVEYKHYYGGDFYIRFGRYPKREQSKINLDEEWIQELHGRRFESGVSVYKARPANGKWRLIEPNNEKAVYNARFDPMFLADRIASGEIYLVTGTLLPDTGVDGEPLLTDIFPVKKLDPSEIVLGHDRTLEDVVKEYSHSSLRHFKISDKEKRDFAIWFDLLTEDGLADEKFYARYNITDETADNLFSLFDKSNKGREPEKLTPEELEIVKTYIKNFQQYRLKSQVFKGFRPFY